MFGLKSLSTNLLAGILLVVSALLMAFAFAAPEAGSVATLVMWLVSVLVLLGIWAVLLLEVGRRYFGSGSGGSSDGPGP